MAAYNCPWYDVDESSKKCLLLTMLRSQKPLRLVIGQLYVVSLQTFTDVGLLHNNTISEINYRFYCVG